VTMFVQFFKTEVTVFIDNVIMGLMSHWSIIFSIRFSQLILKLSLREIKGKVYKKITINMCYKW